MIELLAQHDLNLQSNPRGTDKGAPKSYVRNFYEKEFAPYRDKHTRILEIGFRHGASLALWSYYFPEAEIIGLDNGSDVSVTGDRPANEQWLSLPKVQPIYGNAYDEAFAKGIAGQFDILIDDGPHSLSSQITFIKLYADKVASGGVMVVEDIQRYGGLTIWPFLMATPLKYEVDFFDFRHISGAPDDILYVIRNSGKRQISSRLRLLARALVYSITDPIKFIRRKLVARSKR